MSRWTRSRRLLAQPAYRTKLIFFLLLGFTTFLLAYLLRPYLPFWSEVFLEFAVAFGAVGALQLLWDFLGGDPVELRLEKIQQSVTMLSDLADGNIGIERIWRDRQTWQEDPTDGRRVWYTRVCQARHIDMMSNTLWDNWIKSKEFLSGLFKHIAQGSAGVRILIYDPDSEVMRLRARDEETGAGEMEGEIAKTLRRVIEMWSDLPVSARMNLEVRLTTQTLHLAQIIRADERMVVAIYLSGETGSPSPTMQLKGSESSYFRKYAEQFEILWQRAEPLNDDRTSQILQEYGRLAALPAED